MARLLPMLVAQVPAHPPDIALDALRTELLTLLEDFRSTRLVVYPEYHSCGVTGGPAERERQYEACAEPLDGARVTRLCDLAREAKVWLIPGTVVERGPAGELFNTAIVLSPDGRIAASYRKIFPWRPFEPFDPGSHFVTFDIEDVGRVGLCVCYDLWFPEVIRNLAWMGAELVICPAETSTRDRKHELILAQANAIQNQVFVLSANAGEPSGAGRSILVDPQGLVRFQAPSESVAYLTDVIDFDVVRQTHEYGTAGLNRMWSQFKPGDPGLRLPAYGGAIDPVHWKCRGHE